MERRGRQALRQCVAVCVMNVGIVRNVALESIAILRNPMQRNATCMECLCEVNTKRIEGHINWHVSLQKAILLASGMLTPEEIKQFQDDTRNYMQGKFSVVH